MPERARELLLDEHQLADLDEARLLSGPATIPERAGPRARELMTRAR